MTQQAGFNGRTALVTGGAHGIGAAIARLVVEVGGTVVIADIDAERGAEVAEGLGARASYLSLDVTSEQETAAAVDLMVRHHGGLDCFFANAGAVGVTGRIEDTTTADWNATQQLLVTSTFLGVKHAVRVMRPRSAGAIVCTASVAGLRGGLGPHAYTAAKHAVKGLVESVAVEVAPYGLRINCVAPGGTVSALSARLVSGDRNDLDAAHRRLAAASSSGVPTTADDVASAAVFLAGPAASRINGATLVVDGGDDVLAQKGRTYYA